MEWSFDPEKTSQRDRIQFLNEASLSNHAIVDFAQNIEFEETNSKAELKSEPKGIYIRLPQVVHLENYYSWL